MKKKVDSIPKVSVWIITYNQEEFIAQCIEGVLMQEIDFPIEIVIGEDCSMDRTREICLSYQERFPDIIRVIENEVNLGFVKNWINTLKVCEGKYIAMCEGDDYWTDPEKLKKQVTILEQNHWATACFHNVCWVDKGGNPLRIFHQKTLIHEFNFNNIIQGWHIHTNSLVFRKSTGIIKDLENYEELKTFSYDRLMAALLADKGEILYIDQVMSAYRRHPESVISNSNQIMIINSNIQVYSYLRKRLKKRRTQINDQLFRLFITRSLYFLQKRELLKYYYSLLKSLFYINSLNNFKGFIKVFLFITR